ncbi:MAG: hypothetical protein O7D30_11145, partial [Rickettsia endosymbiont of Ixodes persulcatus]|nr:hypothetical protein [Rickettsia endosymbiont of Ixodes persulcatus]
NVRNAFSRSYKSNPDVKSAAKSKDLILCTAPLFTRACVSDNYFIFVSLGAWDIEQCAYSRTSSIAGNMS